MEEKKKRNGLVVPFIITIILLIGLVGYICYDKLLVQRNITKTEEKNVNKDSGMKPSNLTTAELEDILTQRIPHELCTYYDILYQESGFNMSNIPENYLLNWLFFNLENYHLDEEIDTTVTLDQIQKELDKLVLNAPKVTIDKIRNNSYVDDDYLEIGVMLYKVVDQKSIKAHYLVTGCAGPEEIYEQKIINSYENDNKLEINVKVAYIHSDGDNIYGKKAVDVLKYPDMNYEEHAVEKVKQDNNHKNIINWNLYDTYKMTFTKANGNYYLDTISLVK